MQTTGDVGAEVCMVFDTLLLQAESGQQKAVSIAVDYYNDERRPFLLCYPTGPTQERTAGTTVGVPIAELMFELDGPLQYSPAGFVFGLLRINQGMRNP